MNQLLTTVCGFCLVFSSGAFTISSAQEQDRIVAATVDGFEITVQSARRQLDQAMPNLKNRDQHATMLKATIDRLIDRRIAYLCLVSEENGAGSGEIRLELEAFKSELAKFDKQLEPHLKENHQTIEELEFELAWRIAWKRYLKEKLTDEYLKNHFEQHRQQFDDSEIRVAHLLLKTDTDEQSIQPAIAQAKSILEKLIRYEIDWSDAVQEHSDAPTKDSAGEIGWIAYDRPMPRSFSVAAFELKQGEVSQPVVTSFGVHLIKCLEIREGKTGWRDAIDEVRKAAAKDIFRQTADRYRENVNVEYQKIPN